jgi:hypothetical protein
MKSLVINSRQIASVNRLVAMVSLAALFLLLCASSAPAQTAASLSDPCLATGKSSQPFFLQGGGFQQVITGSANKRIYVCGVVFYGQGVSQFAINFAGFSSTCTSGFTLLGILRSTNDTVVTAGGGSSTQFTVPASSNLCIELGGVLPLESGGWITYVQQ